MIEAGPARPAIGLSRESARGKSMVGSSVRLLHSLSRAHTHTHTHTRTRTRVRAWGPGTLGPARLPRHPVQVPGTPPGPCARPACGLISPASPFSGSPGGAGDRKTPARASPAEEEEAGRGRREGREGERGGEKESELIGAPRALPSPRRVPRPPRPGGAQGRIQGQAE